MGDDDKYIDLKGEIEETIRNASFKVMSVNVDTLYNWYGKVTGTSVDYASTVSKFVVHNEFLGISLLLQIGNNLIRI